MSFSTISFTGAVSGSVASGLGNLVTSGAFTVTLSGDDSGAVTGTWSYTGTYDNHNPYYPNSGAKTLSGTVSGTGGESGPWALTLSGSGAESQGLTLSYANGEWSLDGQGGFVIDYVAVGGYDAEFTYHDHYRFGTNLDVAGAGPGGVGGTAGNDTFTMGAGNETIDGGAGVDTAVFSDVRANYTVSHDGATWTVSHTGGETDTLTNVERLQFADAKLAIDIEGHGGQAYRLYKAAFDREPDVPGLGYQMNELDKGFSLSQVASAFIASPEFQAKYGSAVDDAAFITLLYRNVLDREPEAEGLQFHLNELAAGESRADLLTHFSESPENQANVLGLIAGGMLYTL